jgi:hypothetical protein
MEREFPEYDAGPHRVLMLCKPAESGARAWGGTVQETAKFYEKSALQDW